MSMLTLENLTNTLTLFIPPFQNIKLYLVGCGGTGSWLAPGLARVARLLIDRFGRDTEVIFTDPDIVQEKNIYRQNFCYAEIGIPKAEALASRYGLAWGLDISAEVKEFGGTSYGGLSIIIGCVDNSSARLEIADQFRSYGDVPTVWWLDCGNGKSHGQIILGAGGEKPDNPYGMPGYTTWLEWPATRHPQILEDAPVSSDPLEDDLSCAELALVDQQGLVINQRIAVEATDYLVRMLLTNNLRKKETYIDLETGTTKSEYIYKE